MIGICSYKDLANYGYWDEKFGYRERDWYVIILGNLNSHQESPALKLILDNYSYLNKRTKDVRYFMPGFMVTDKGIKSFLRTSWTTRLGEIFHFNKKKFEFDEDGFIETVHWLEESVNYEYSEDTEMILLPYHRKSMQHEPVCDFEHMLSYNLDSLLKQDKNIIYFITKAVKVVSKNMTFAETKELMARVFEDTMNAKMHKVFVAGAKALDRERDGVRSALSQLSNRGKTLFQTWTFEDFPRSFTKDGRQCDYDTFIRESADSVVFVIDDRIGGITRHEFDIAINSFLTSTHPQILAYVQVESADSRFDRDINYIKDRCNELHQYYNDYTDIKDLKNQVMRDIPDALSRGGK